VNADDDHLLVDRQFQHIVDAEVFAEANRHLDSHIRRTRRWLKEMADAGHEATLTALIERILDEPNQRHPVLVAYATALWRLILLEDAK
jgi:hypothetical protein